MFNDGIGLDLASWMKFGRIFPENLNGTDFRPLLSQFRERSRYAFIYCRLVQRCRQGGAERFSDCGRDTR